MSIFGIRTTATMGRTTVGRRRSKHKPLESSQAKKPTQKTSE